MPLLTTGKILLALIGLATAIGPYLADWSETHVLNPNWPPHARYHNGQTMSTGLLLGLLIFYYVFSSPASAGKSEERSNSGHALLFVHIYYLPSLSGILYPGALFTDPEFGEGHPQIYLFSAFMGIAWLGWWLERRRLGAGAGLIGKRD